MDALISLDELRTYLRLPDLDETLGEQLALMASAAVRGDVGQVISLVQDDQITLYGAGHAVLLLPELPVVEVGAVVLEGETLTTAGWRLRGPGVLQGRYCGLPAGWPDGATVEVTYTHGYAAVPDVARTVALQVAGRLHANPGMLSAATIGSVALSYGATGVPDLLAAERTMLDGLRPGER